MKLYCNVLSVIYVLLLVGCSSYSSEVRSTAARHYDYIGVLHEFASQVRGCLDVQNAGHHFYSTGVSNDTDDEAAILNLGDHFDFNIDVNSTCYKDIIYTIGNIANVANPWALQLIDSYGKPESGILQANFKWFGDYYECVNVHAPPLHTHGYGNTKVGNFHGRYCTLVYTIALGKNDLSITNGICIPDSCSATKLTKDFSKLLDIAKSIPVLKGNQSIFNATLTCKPTSKPLNAPAIAMICLMTFFGILALIGSLVTVSEYIFKEARVKKHSFCSADTGNSSTQINDTEDVSQKNVLLKDDESHFEDSGCFQKCKPFLKCFCVFTNGAKLLNTDATEGQLLCLHGIRFLSMSWVILCHTVISFAIVIRNYPETLHLIDNFAFQVILNGFYSVDSFFVLSGLLLAYLFFQEYSKRKEQMSWIYFYVHRYLRLTPVYMIVLGFQTTVYMYMGSGPFWPDYDVEPRCKENWWWNLLYINNFRPQAKQCMAWSWYLANDMQFFVISPLFLILLYRWPKIGFTTVGLALLASFSANFAITYHYDLMSGVNNLGGLGENLAEILQKFATFFDKIYIKPYTRIGPYLIGIILAYILFKEKTSNIPKFNWITLCCGWVTASAVTLTCLYGLYHKNPAVLAASFYNALNRTCFAGGLAWVIYVCLTGQGGFVNSILSYKLFIPLSRLTYCAYLIHPIIIDAYFSTMKSTLFFSYSALVISFLGALMVSYPLALVVSLIFESPIIGLEKLVRTKYKS